MEFASRNPSCHAPPWLKELFNRLRPKLCLISYPTRVYLFAYF